MNCLRKWLSSLSTTVHYILKRGSKKCHLVLQKGNNITYPKNWIRNRKGNGLNNYDFPCNGYLLELSWAVLFHFQYLQFTFYKFWLQNLKLIFLLRCNNLTTRFFQRLSDSKNSKETLETSKKMGKYLFCKLIICQFSSIRHKLHALHPLSISLVS